MLYFQSVQYSSDTAAVYANYGLHCLSGHNSNQCFLSPFSACSLLVCFQIFVCMFLNSNKNSKKKFFFFCVTFHMKNSEWQLTWHTGQTAFVCVWACSSAALAQECLHTNMYALAICLCVYLLCVCLFCLPSGPERVESED